MATKCVFNRREIDDQDVIANSQTARVMSSAADSEQQITFSRKVYRVDHIRDIRAAHDQARLLMDHSIVDFAGIIITVIVRLFTPPFRFAFSSSMECVGGILLAALCDCRAFVFIRTVSSPSTVSMGSHEPARASGEMTEA